MWRTRTLDFLAGLCAHVTQACTTSAPLAMPTLLESWAQSNNASSLALGASSLDHFPYGLGHHLRILLLPWMPYVRLGCVHANSFVTPTEWNIFGNGVRFLGKVLRVIDFIVRLCVRVTARHFGRRGTYGQLQPLLPSSFVASNVSLHLPMVLLTYLATKVVDRFVHSCQ
jgi:hypothetical protein